MQVPQFTIHIHAQEHKRNIHSVLCEVEKMMYSTKYHKINELNNCKPSIKSYKSDHRLSMQIKTIKLYMSSLSFHIKKF